MRTYYSLSCPSDPMGDDPAPLTYLPDEDARGWETGVPFSDDPMDFPEEREPPTPIRFCIHLDDAGALRELWEAPAPVMTRRLARAIRAAGVTNLDLYDAVIDDRPTGQTHTDYVAFNIIGLARAAEEPLGEQAPLRWVDEDVFRSGAPPEFLLFRLASMPYYIIVHERVKAHLERAGFGSLRYSEHPIGPARSAP